MTAPQTSGFLEAGDPSRPRSDATVPFRDLIPGPDHLRTKGVDSCDAHKWCDSRRQIDAAAWLINRLDAKNLGPYIGFTSDGHVEEDVYQYAKDEGAPVQDMAHGANAVLDLLSASQREATLFTSVQVDEFRLLSNPELYVNPGGLRLDECSAKIQNAVHSLLRASFSKAGYEKVLGCCLTNDFLGHLVHGEKVLNQHSYNFRLFDHPDLEKPWGYTFFGHHLCLAVVVRGGQMVIGPTFMGAEPDVIDEGPHTGLRLFETEEILPLKLMQRLPPELQSKATLSKGMDGASLPADRWNPFDERHLGGARQDNRIVPYEGCPVRLFSAEQQAQVCEIFRAFNECYPDPVLQHRLQNFRAHLDRTYFAWIGEHGDDDPFYYRIHSPVAFMELDFHCGSMHSPFSGSSLGLYSNSTQ